MSVNALKSLVTASGGLARPNKFAIELPNIPGIDLTNRDLNLLCRTVSMPSKQISKREIFTLSFQLNSTNSAYLKFVG